MSQDAVTKHSEVEKQNKVGRGAVGCAGNEMRKHGRILSHLGNINLGEDKEQTWAV
jgi:hypothetical protein